MSPAAFTGVELEVAAAVLLGGTSFTGGTGSVIGTFIGVLFIAILKNGLSLMGVSSFLQGIFTGVVLIVAVVADTLRTKKSQ
jgi:ribose transport system permease protein